MSQGVVQAVKGTETIGVTASCAVTAITAGSTVVAILEHSAGFLGAPAVTGPAGFTYCGTQAFEPNKASVDIWYKDNESGGQTSYSATGPNNVSKILFILELSGMTISVSNDVNENFVGSTVANMGVGGFVQEGQGHEIVIAGFSTNINNVVSTGSGTFTGSVENHNSDGSYLVTYYLNTGGGAVSMAATNTIGSTYSYAAKLATFREAPKSYTVISPVGSGVAGLVSLHVVPKLLAVVGTGLTKISKVLHKKLALVGSATTLLKEAKVKFVSFHASSSGTAKVLKRIPRKIATSSGGVSSFVKTRLRSIAAIGTGTASLAKVRAHLIHLLGSGKLGFKLTFKKNIKVIGAGVSGVFKTRFRTVAAASSGVAHLVKTRLKFIKVLSSQVISMNFIRSITMKILGSGVPNLKSLRTYLVLIKVLATGSKVVLSRHFTRTMKISGGGTVIIKVPRLLKKTIAVTGSKVLSFLKRVGTGTANGVSYSITSREETDYKIKVK